MAANSTARQLFEMIDLDGDGQISRDEFHKVLSYPFVSRLAHGLEQGMTGRRKKELRALLSATGHDWKMVLAQIDANEDGIFGDKPVLSFSPAFDGFSEAVDDDIRVAEA